MLRTLGGTKAKPAALCRCRNDLKEDPQPLAVRLEVERMQPVIVHGDLFVVAALRPEHMQRLCPQRESHHVAPPRLSKHAML